MLIYSQRTIGRINRVLILAIKSKKRNLKEGFKLNIYENNISRKIETIIVCRFTAKTNKK